MLSAPSYVDRLLHPVTCAHCFDFRGVTFAIFVVVLIPLGAVLISAAWLLPRKPTIVGLAVVGLEVALLGLIGYDLLEEGAQHSVSIDPPPYPLDVAQNALLNVPPVFALGACLSWLARAHPPRDPGMRLVRIGIAVQVTAMIACILLTTPHVSNRLSNGPSFSQEGMSFVAWTVFLLPAVLLLLLSGWGMNGARRIWLLLGVDIWLLGAMTVFSMLHSPGPPGTQLDRLPYPFITAQGLLITLPAVLTLLFGLIRLARLGRSQRQPPAGAPI